MPVDIRKPLKKFLPHLQKAQADNLNEADTVQRVIKVFEEVLGYDPMDEISREAAVKDKFVDVAIKLDGTVRVLVEAKAAGVVLRDRHIDQAQSYAAHSNIPWVVLTNGVTWNLYHLTFEEGIESTLAFSVSLTDAPGDKECELLALLHRQSLKKGELEEYWEHRVALGPASIGRAIFTEDTLKFIRREIRRREGILIDEEDLASAIHSMFSADAREAMGPMKIRRRRRKTGGNGETVAGEVAIESSARGPEAPPPPKTDGN
jgi:predicted type IV restriction endonuclease